MVHALDLGVLPIRHRHLDRGDAGLGFVGPGQGWKLTESGGTALDGVLPVNCSGGVLSSNPIGASGLRMLFECWTQLRGEAGEKQQHVHRRDTHK